MQQYINTATKIAKVSRGLLFSNKPKNVHATNEIIPNIKGMIAKINSPTKRITIAIVMRVTEKSK